jgi:hypothetical protein
MRKLAVTAGVLTALVAAGFFLWPRSETATPTAPEEPVPEFQAVEVTAQAQEGMTLSGVVKDATGKPLADATVSLAATTQSSLTTLECGDCKRQLLSCPARETGLKVASLLGAKKGELAAALTTTTDGKASAKA